MLGTSNTSATRVQHDRHECDTSAKQTARLRHKKKKLNLITRRVKTYFHTPILAIWLMKDYKERNNFILRFTFSICIVQMRLKRAPQKLNFVIAKAISKSCTLDCSCKYPCTLPHSYR